MTLNIIGTIIGIRIQNTISLLLSNVEDLVESLVEDLVENLVEDLVENLVEDLGENQVALEEVGLSLEDLEKRNLKKRPKIVTKKIPGKFLH